MLQQLLVCSSEELVEDVEVPLARHLADHPGLLQEVVQYVTAFGRAFVVELYVHVFAEAARVVVPVGFGVTERLQQRIALEEFVFDCLHVAEVVRPGRDVLQDLLGGLGFARTGLAYGRIGGL